MKLLICTFLFALASSAKILDLAPSTITRQAPNCNENWIGDKYCDDVNNNADCGFDGGDCCDNSFWNWNAYCTECACLGKGPECIFVMIGDTFCDDENNNAACNFDGGDCCNNPNPLWYAYCSDCSCLSP